MTTTPPDGRDGIPTELVGLAVDPVVHRVDERWTMAYAASLRDHHPAYLDTTRAGGVVAHPIFPVCVEWPAIVATREASRAAGLSQAQMLSSVHATHDLTIHRLVRPGDTLTTSIELVAMVDKSPGARSTMRLSTRDADGGLVATTTQHGIYLGHPTVGDDIADPNPPPPLVVASEGADHVGSDAIEIELPLLAGDAHTYTECARIWNPIHTDRAVALATGLPDIILHGTANLAHGVSQVIAHRAGNDPHRVRRVVARFAAMVRMPSSLRVRIGAPRRVDPATSTDQDGAPGAPASPTTAVPFVVLNEHGDPAVDRGFVVLGDSLS